MSRDYKKFKAHQEKGSLWHQFQDSKILKPILEKWLHVKPRKTKIWNVVELNISKLVVLH